MIKTINKQRNCSIDIFRYLCSIMVVIIHTNPLTEINYVLSYILVTIFPRIAVPFFFAVAGYFYIQKLENGKRPFSPYIKRLLLTYGIWSLVYITLDFVQWGHAEHENFIKDVLWGIFLKGTYYHFWFFPALIIAVCITTFLFKIKCKKLLVPLGLICYVLGTLCSSYYQAVENIPILGDFIKTISPLSDIFFYGFPFFISGYLVFILKDKIFEKLSVKFSIAILLCSVCIWLTEIFLIVKLNLHRNILLSFTFYPLVMVVLLTLLRFPLSKYDKTAGLCKTLANFTYYSHPLFITCIMNSLKRIFEFEIAQTPLFIATVCITLLFGIIIHKINNKYLNVLVN